jgi:hypothetical protein
MQQRAGDSTLARDLCEYLPVIDDRKSSPRSDSTHAIIHSVTSRRVMLPPDGYSRHARGCGGRQSVCVIATWMGLHSIESERRPPPPAAGILQEHGLHDPPPGGN